MEKKNVIFLSVMAVATLLTAVVGTTFAYFTATITGNETAKATVVQTATLAAVFNDGDQINVTDIIPGTTIPSKTFTIKNSSDVAMKYNIKWEDVTLSKALPDLKYTVTSSGTGAAASITTPTAVPSSNITLIPTTEIAAGATHTYTLNLTFADTGVNQNEQQAASFSAKLKAYAGTSDTSLSAN